MVYAQPTADPPWSILSWLDGARFDHFLVDADHSQIEAVASSAGRVLAAIHSFSFPTAGFFGPDLSIEYPIDASNGWTSLFEEWLFRGRAGPRLGDDLRSRLWRVITANEWRLDEVRDDPRLLHADYKPWNLLVRDGEVAAVLDWEFAFAGPPLNDVGIFLRHSRALPASYARGFERGYREAGGRLPEGWRRLSRLLDLLSLCQFLERPEDDPAVLRDVRPLIEMTVDEFAP